MANFPFSCQLFGCLALSAFSNCINLLEVGTLVHLMAFERLFALFWGNMRI
jgi:hypothetical protein